MDGKDYVFYVMPLYADTLKGKIKAGIPNDKVLDIFIGLLEGLRYAHMHETIHRDIKPENIMFAQNSFEPVICDFGIAHFAEEDLLTVVETKDTDRMANFQYAAPEQRKRGGKVYPQTDIYSVGLILNEMFTGDIAQAGGYKKIGDVNPEYSYLDEVFEKLFRQDPLERLYPEEKILTEVNLLADKYHKEQEKKKLQAVVNELAEPEDFVAQIVDMKYTDGKLLFICDKDLPDPWLWILARGEYAHTAFMDYDCNKIRAWYNNGFSMRIYPDESKDTVRQIIGYIKDWVDKTNRKYSRELKEEARRKQQEEEAKRLEEIRKLEKTVNFENMLSEILEEM